MVSSQDSTKPPSTDICNQFMSVFFQIPVVQSNVRFVLAHADCRLAHTGHLMDEKLACDKMGLLGS